MRGIELGPEKLKQHVAAMPCTGTRRREVRQKRKTLRLAKERFYVRSVVCQKPDFPQQSELDHE